MLLISAILERKNMTTIEKLVRMAECVYLYGDFGSNIREKLAIEFLSYVNVRPEQLISQPRGKWAELHETLRAFRPEEKINAVRWLREEIKRRVQYAPSIVYTKRYVEWVWGQSNTEPVWNEVPF